jgi:hypothetical protein
MVCFCASGDVGVIKEPSGMYILKTDILAAGTQLRVGSAAVDFRAIEELCLGDEVFDPIEERLVEITEMACITLDPDTIRDRGFSPKQMVGDISPSPLLYAVKVPVMLARAGYLPPIRGEYTLPEGTVFFSLGFERRTIVETPTTYCEFIRASNYPFETPLRRTSGMMRDEALPLVR